MTVELARQMREPARAAKDRVITDMHCVRSGHGLALLDISRQFQPFETQANIGPPLADRPLVSAIKGGRLFGACIVVELSAVTGDAVLSNRAQHLTGGVIGDDIKSAGLIIDFEQAGGGQSLHAHINPRQIEAEREMVIAQLPFEPRIADFFGKWNAYRGERGVDGQGVVGVRRAIGIAQTEARRLWIDGLGRCQIGRQLGGGRVGIAGKKRVPPGTGTPVTQVFAEGQAVVQFGAPFDGILVEPDFGTTTEIERVGLSIGILHPGGGGIGTGQGAVEGVEAGDRFDLAIRP